MSLLMDETVREWAKRIGSDIDVVVGLDVQVLPERMRKIMSCGPKAFISRQTLAMAKSKGTH